MVQGHSQSPPGSPVSVSMYFASNRDVPSVDPKDPTQTAVAPAQWLALLAIPQSINLPIIEVQRGIILPHLCPEDLESYHPGIADMFILPFCYLIQGSQNMGYRAQAHLQCSLSGWDLGFYLSQGSADTDASGHKHA